jgi:hypothetical protein
MSLFGKKSEISRTEFEEILKKPEPGPLTESERLRIEKEVLPLKKYGGTISKSDVMRGIQELQKQRMQAKNYSEKIKITREIDFLRKLMSK